MRLLTTFSSSICTAMTLGSLTAEQVKESGESSTGEKKSAPEKVATVANEEVKKSLGEMQKLLGQRKFQESAKLGETVLARKDLGESEQQTGLTLQYFSLMGARDFSKALVVAKTLEELKKNTPGGSQAVAMRKRAEAALAAGEKKETPVKKVQAAKVAKPSESASSKPAPSKEKAARKSNVIKKPAAVPSHEKALADLDASHRTLARAEKAFATAEAKLKAAQKAHNEAHQKELVAREASEKTSQEAVGAETPGKEPELAQKEEEKAAKDAQEAAQKESASAKQVEGFVSRAADLQEKAAQLRKKAAEMRKAAEE